MITKNGKKWVGKIKKYQYVISNNINFPNAILEGLESKSLRFQISKDSLVVTIA